MMAKAARRTFRVLSDRIDRRTAHTMRFTREAGHFLHAYDTWLGIRDEGWPDSEQRAKLKAMQDACVQHGIITAEEIAAINTRCGVQL